MAKSEMISRELMTQSSTNDPNVWRSSSKVIKAVKRVMGGIDCDPCALPEEWKTKHGKINYRHPENGLSQESTWGQTNWVCPGHEADPLAWFAKAEQEMVRGKLLQAILCFPESALMLPSRLFWFPVAITAKPLTVTKLSQGKEVEFQLPTRSLFVYLTADEPDAERFARAFRDIATVYAPVAIEG